MPDASATAAQVAPAAAPDLTSPEAAAASWLAAWCPIDPHRNPAAAAATIRAAMTDRGVGAIHRHTGTCTGVRHSRTDRDVRRAAWPGSCPAHRAADRLVVVAVSATRTVIDAGHAGARRFRIERRQYVARGGDGLWRVDVAAVGG